MSKFVATFDGRIVAEPEPKELPSGASLLQFPVYVNERRKNRDTGEYEDTGNVSKIRVTLWNDAALNADWRKGDIVEVQASLVEREFDKRDGTKGRQLETSFVDSITLIKRFEDNDPPVSKNGFYDADDGDDAWATPGGGF